jgi:hypothetical protein
MSHLPSAGCRCLHCQCPIEAGLASGLCVECYLDAVYDADTAEYPPCGLCGMKFADCECVPNYRPCSRPPGVPCPGASFLPL